MKNGRTIDVIDRALRMAHNHSLGNRDETLPSHLDSQITRFLQTLKEMKKSIQEDDDYIAFRPHMCRAVSDSWPYESRLGQLICEAEHAFLSYRSRTS